MTATIQKELAERITARPGSKDYGALSMWIQSQCRVEILRTLPPEAFWPRPKVSSAFIQITLDDALRRRIPDRKFFHDFVRAMFLPPPQVPALGTAHRGQRTAGQARRSTPSWPGWTSTARSGPNSSTWTTMLALCEAVRVLVEQTEGRQTGS